MVQKSRARTKRTLIVALMLTLSAITIGMLGTSSATAGTVPGQSGDRYDSDNNGYPDAGKVVSGNYTDIYSDADGVCEVRVNYRGTFENTPYMDSGWIQNHYRCVAPDGSTTTYNYLFVHQTDPRYTGNPEWSIWNTWEYQVLTEGGSGNAVRPVNHVS